MSSGTDPFARAMRGLLRPLVRMLIARGITAPAFYRVLKQVYVEVARDEFRLGDAPPTDSRVTLLTGVHRRDVRAIVAAGDDGWPAARAKAAAFATVIARWRAGGATPLDRAAFDALVEGISRDIRPRTVLDELLRQGAVIEEGETLRLSPGATAAPAPDEAKLAFFATNVGDHLAAAAANLDADPPPFLERAVFFNRMPAAEVDRIEAHARDASQTLLEDLAARSTQVQRASAEVPDAADARTRYRFGVWFYREDPGAASSEEGDG